MCVAAVEAAGMHIRRATASVVIVLAAALAGCADVRNMSELKAAVGHAPEPEAALPPEAPVARAMAFPTVARVNETIVFTAAGSGDPEGRQIVHLWAFNDGTRAEGEEVRHAFERPGEYHVELTVSDTDGLFAVASVDVRVLPDDLPPSVGVRVLDARGVESSRTTPSVPLELRALVADPEGKPVAVAWDFGDGGVATEAETRHAWTAPGRYTVTLRATDPAGLANRTTTVVTVDYAATRSGLLAAGDPPAVLAFPGGPAASLEAVVGYDAALGANDLVLRVLDADGRVLGESALAPGTAAQGAVNESVELDALALRDGAPGEWHVVVERVSGVRVAYTLSLDLRY